MRILVERKTWYRRPAPNAIPRPGSLTPEQAENTRLAVLAMKHRFPSVAIYAEALGISVASYEKLRSGRRRPTMRYAHALALLAEVPVEDVLSGVWAPKGACPYCGRT